MKRSLKNQIKKWLEQEETLCLDILSPTRIRHIHPLKCEYSYGDCVDGKLIDREASICFAVGVWDEIDGSEFERRAQIEPWLCRRGLLTTSDGLPERTHELNPIDFSRVDLCPECVGAAMDLMVNRPDLMEPADHIWPRPKPPCACESRAPASDSVTPERE